MLIAESEESILEKLGRWRNEFEIKGWKVNGGRTKMMKCKLCSGVVEESAKWQCGVCSNGFGKNSTFCTKCQKRIHKRCNRIKGKIVYSVGFQCHKCHVDRYVLLK